MTAANCSSPEGEREFYALLDAYEVSGAHSDAQRVAAHLGREQSIPAAHKLCSDLLATYSWPKHRGWFAAHEEPGAPAEDRWHTVAPGPDGPELHHDDLRVRFLADGRVLVWDENRGRWVEAPERARRPADATRIAIGLLLEFDMRADARREIDVRERDRQRGRTRDAFAGRDEVREVRRRLDDPARVVHALGIEKGARRQPGGLIVLCPWHNDRNPSCSVTIGKDGTLRAHCFSCGESGDVLGLVAAVRGLDTQREFRRVLEAAADLAGLELRGAA